ncbi:MAG: tetratricopeptide repeat protein [Planctomycetes bacterium]|nr:tetratricopeptide repeat protein [Planctomycetota bacterium]
MSQDHRHRPLLVHDYERYLVDQDVDLYLRRVSSRYTVGGLERVATSADRAARRGAVLALGRLAEYRSNVALGRALVDSDRGVRVLAEHGIRRLWQPIGTASQKQHLVGIGLHLEVKNYDRAAQLSTAMVEDAPWIAEAWYYRGKAFFHLEQHEAATRDCHQALEINAYHFMAASVMGQAYLLLGDPVSALDSFRRALRLNPNMEEVRAQVIHLQRSLKDEK